MVTLENYEEYMILQADGELDEAGTEALQAFLAKHPELAEEMKLFESLRLEPDTTMVYAGKEELLKPVPAKRTIALGWRSMAAAAGVAAVVCIAAWQYLHTGPETGNDSGTVAGIVTPATTITKTTTNPAVSTTADTQIQTAPQPVINTNDVAAVNKSSYKPQHRENTPAPQQQAALATLQPLDASSLPVDAVAADKISETAPEVQIQAIKEEKRTKNLVAWLPISEEKKQGLEMVKEAINQRVEQVKEINNNIKETTLVLNIGQKGITLNF